MAPKIFLTRTLPETVMALMKERFEVVQAPRDRPLSAREIIDGAQGCDGIVAMLSDPVTADILKNCPTVRIVANYAAGTNNVDLEAARAGNVAVSNTPCVLTEATADLAFALLLAVARRIVEGHQLVHSGRWDGWGPTLMLGQEIQAKRLGIIGMGKIGCAMARRAQGFGMDIVYHNRNRVAEGVERALDCHLVSLDELLRSSDYISIHCPLTPETRNLLDAKAFTRIKHGAYLINTARGEVVDEAAMIAALDDGTLTGAGLDVFTGEPDVNPRLLELENVVVAPHVGSATYDTRTHMGEVAINNLSAFFEGRDMPNRVV